MKQFWKARATQTPLS